MDHRRVVFARSGEEITLRPAVPEDARGIIETVCSVALERSYVLMEKYRKSEEIERLHISNMNRDYNLLLVAQIQDQVVGSLAALQAGGGKYHPYANNLEVGIHLRQEYRGLHIGKHMLNYAMDWAKDKGFTKMEATIFVTNKRSLRLFSQAGFQEEETKRRKFRIGCGFIEELVMVKYF